MRPRLEEEDTVLLRRLPKSQKKQNKTKQNRGFSSSLILLRALCILFLPFFLEDLWILSPLVNRIMGFVSLKYLF